MNRPRGATVTGFARTSRLVVVDVATLSLVDAGVSAGGAGGDGDGESGSAGGDGGTGGQGGQIGGSSGDVENGGESSK